MKTHPHLELVRKYARASRRAALSHDEKADMRQRLIRQTGLSPLDAASVSRALGPSRVSSPYSKYLNRTGKVVAPLMLLAIIGGGTSYAAESSLPGDLLYPVKIHVNENVVSGLSFSPLSKATWAVQKVKRRLEEVKAIGLQSAAKVGLDAAVVAETNDADAKIAALEASDPADAGELTRQLGGLIEDDGIEASTSPIDVDLSTSTDTTSTEVSEKIVHKIVVPSVSLPAATSGTISASAQSSDTGAGATSNVTSNANVNANVKAGTSVVPAVPAVSTPTVTAPTIPAPTIPAPAVSAPSASVPAVAVPSVTVSPVTVPAVSAPSASVSSAASGATNAGSSIKSGLGL